MLRRGRCFTLWIGLRLPQLRVKQLSHAFYFCLTHCGAGETKTFKMKRVMFTAFAVGLCLTANVMAQVPSYVPSNGLVGYWPFNGNANDESGNGNNGTVNGATLTADRFGNSGMAFNYNAFNWSWGSGGDYTYIPFNSSFNTSEITISVWFSESSNYISNQDYPTIVKRFEGGYSNPNVRLGVYSQIQTETH